MIWNPLFRQPLKHIYKLVRDPEYRRWQWLHSRLAARPRYQESSVKVFGGEVLFPDAASFLSAYREIFVGRIYDFEASNSQPRILDWGANIGLSVLFFKQLYPQAQITAHEADPKIHRYLKHNIQAAGLRDVELVNKAVWIKNGSLQFASEGADAGRVGDAPGDVKAVTVSAVAASGLLEAEETIDYLKIDIEGAELEVLPSCAPHLGKVGRIFVEYHSPEGAPQRLADVIGTLENAGFRLHIQPIVNQLHPASRPWIQSGFDLQLNIYGTR